MIESSVIYILNAKLSVICAALDPDHRDGFTSPLETAREEALKCYKIVQDLLSESPSFEAGR